MTVHKLLMIERKPGGIPAPHPTECRAHHDAGRIPIFHGTRLVAVGTGLATRPPRLVAYVDQPEDLPEAKFIERDSRIVGEVSRWEYGR